MRIYTHQMVELFVFWWTQYLAAPVLGNVDKMVDICQSRGTVGDLINVANRSFEIYDSGNEMRKIKLVSYATPGIFDYAAYSLAINSIYALRNGYDMIMIDAERGNHEPHDSRWNKVKILEDLLEEHSAADGVEYFVWLDSDLIMLDMAFDLETQIIQSHPQADIIMSRDPRPENGVVNTGAIIVRNSAFSRAFLARWWHQFDRKAGMDQHSFDKVWSRAQVDAHTPGGCPIDEGGEREGGCLYCLDCLNDDEYSSHFAFLPPNAINSAFPAWRFQTDSDPVLHLAGLSTVARRAVFQRGLDTLCEAITEGVLEQGGGRGKEAEFGHLRPTKQLGLSRGVLRGIVLDISLQHKAVVQADADLRRLEAQLGRALREMMIGAQRSSGTGSDTGTDTGILAQQRSSEGGTFSNTDPSTLLSHVAVLQAGLSSCSNIMHSLKDSRQTGYDAAEEMRGGRLLRDGPTARARMSMTEHTALTVSEGLVGLLVAIRTKCVLLLSSLPPPPLPARSSGGDGGDADGDDEYMRVRAATMAAGVRALQLTVETSFDLLQAMLYPPSDPVAMAGEGEHIAAKVSKTRESVNMLRVLAISGHDNGDISAGSHGDGDSGGSDDVSMLATALYYDFKLYHFQAALYTSRHADTSAVLPEVERWEAELSALHRAHAVWGGLHQLGWYGHGNGLADPGREIAEIRARMGSLYVALWQQGQQGQQGQGRGWSSWEEGAVCLLDALDLSLWRWEVLLDRDMQWQEHGHEQGNSESGGGEVEGLGTRLRRMQTEIVAVIAPADKIEQEEGVSWSLKGGDFDSSGSAGGLGSLPVPAMSVEVPVYVYQQLWGISVALAHALSLPRAAGADRWGSGLWRAVLGVCHRVGEGWQAKGGVVDWALLEGLRDSSSSSSSSSSGGKDSGGKGSTGDEEEEEGEQGRRVRRLKRRERR